jgi:hypothetical protein
MGTFLVRAMSEGTPWLWRLLTHVLTLVTLLAVAAGVIVVGVLLHQAAWLVAAAAVVLVFVVFAQGAYRVWRGTQDELTEARKEVAEVVEAKEGRDLKPLLNAGLKFQGLLDASEETVRPFYKEDPVYHWAWETWKALQHENPAAAKIFFGDKTPYLDRFFATAFGIEVDGSGRRIYLDSRLAILEQVVAES